VNAIVGTAGHIDHGKTALVRALTGIDTDRLPEEQRRGISIELGFAWFDAGDGGRTGVVDVPGHERFVRQMLAGAQGFDLLLLVVAADDGVMPQTEEHFEICHLLGVRAALFVITKADLVTEARIEEVKEDIAILAAGTRFDRAPVLVTSTVSGRGLEDLRDAIRTALSDFERAPEQGAFRMPVDRSFVVAGHGVVVTGTAAGGCLHPGDDVQIQPAGFKARVRSIQVHGVAVESAAAGQRVAVNLAGLDRSQVQRGDTITGGGVKSVTDRFDARVEVRPSAGRAVRSHERLRVYLGTREVPGRIVWLRDGAVEPRDSAYAQIVLAEPAVVFAKERFVLREENAGRTLGGGVVLLAHAGRHRRADSADVSRALTAIESEDPASRLRAFLGMMPSTAAAPSAVAAGLGISETDVKTLAEGDAFVVSLRDGAAGFWLAARERLDGLAERVTAAVAAHHASQPSRVGVELEQLRQRAETELDGRVFRSIVESLGERGVVVRRGNLVALPGHSVALSERGERHAEKVAAMLRAGGVMPPPFAQLQDDLGLTAAELSEIVGVLQERGGVTRVAEDLAFASDVVLGVERKLKEHLAKAREVTAAEFRDLIGASRKYSIPLLDYFDRQGLTLRSGDVRRLRRQ
jgi:selenocysteine-specific elongation factor